MDYSNDFFKPDKIDLAFFVFLLFIMLCNVTFCVEDDIVSLKFYSGLGIAQSSNVFYNGDGIYGFKLEKGYIYHIENPYPAGRLAVSPAEPTLNGIYTWLGYIAEEGNFTYAVTSDTYMFFESNRNVVVTREKITDMNGVVTILSNDVGTNQFWNVFFLAIPFILIVVIVVFGFFIVKRLTKKESKGDIRF